MSYIDDDLKIDEEEEEEEEEEVLNTDGELDEVIEDPLLIDDDLLDNDFISVDDSEL